MSIIKTILNSVANGDAKPVVRVKGVIGGKTLYTYFPEAKTPKLNVNKIGDSGLSFSVQEKEGLHCLMMNGQELASFEAQDKAKDALGQIIKTVAPSASRWFWRIAAVAVLFVIFSPSSKGPNTVAFQPASPTYAKPGASPFQVTPVNPGALPPGVRPADPFAGAPTAPANLAPAAPAQGASADPFGLNVTPNK